MVWNGPTLRNDILCLKGQLARCCENKITVTVKETKEDSKSWEHTAGVEVTVS